jgi:hypothetical protein
MRGRPRGKKTGPAKRSVRFLRDPNRVCAEMAKTYAETWSDDGHKHTFKEGIKWAIEEVYEKHWLGEDGKGERPDPDKVTDLCRHGRTGPTWWVAPKRAPLEPLKERTWHTDDGRTITEFHGDSPRVWMDQFAVPRQYAVINTPKRRKRKMPNLSGAKKEIKW